MIAGIEFGQRAEEYVESVILPTEEIVTVKIYQQVTAACKHLLVSSRTSKIVKFENLW